MSSESDDERPFRMAITDVFWLAGRTGPIVTGESYEGNVSVGEALTLVSPDGSRREVIVRGVGFVCGVGHSSALNSPLSLVLGDELRHHDLSPAAGLTLEASPSDES